MAAKSLFLDDAVLSAVLQNTSYAGGANTYVSLYTVAPTPSTSGTEVADANYARQAVLAVSGWTTPTSGQRANAGTISFFGAGAAGSVGSVVAVGVMDASSGGHLLYFGNLTVAKTIGIGDTMSFAVAALTVQEQ